MKETDFHSEAPKVARDSSQFPRKMSVGDEIDLEKERKRERQHRRPFDRMCHLVPGSRTSSY